MMQEKIYTTKKNGMIAMLLTILLLIAAIGAIVAGAVMEEKEISGSIAVLILGIVLCVIGWIPFMGLKVLKPQEALVLTLFGDYKGTIREPGFYFVNPLYHVFFKK